MGRRGKGEERERGKEGKGKRGKGEKRERGKEGKGKRGKREEGRGCKGGKRKRRKLKKRERKGSGEKGEARTYVYITKCCRGKKGSLAIFYRIAYHSKYAGVKG